MGTTSTLPTPTSASSGVTMPGPGLVPLSIGGLTFYSEEAPEKLPIGGVEQMVAVHTPIGGGRVVLRMGAKPMDVSWTGKCFASRVQGDIQQLRFMCSSGNEVPITWGNEQYHCVVTKFLPTYQNSWVCVFDLTIVITRDDNGAFSAVAPLSIDTQVTALQTQVNGLSANLTTLSINTPSETQLVAQPTLNVPSPSSFASSITAFNQALAIALPLAQNIVTQGPSLAAAANAAAAAVGSYISTLPQGTQNVAYPTASILQSSLYAVAANVSRGQTVSTSRVMGGSLFTLASQKYGDPSLAFQLASANGLPSPFISAQSSQLIAFPPFGTKP